MLRDCISSIQANTSQISYEIIIIDNNSSEGNIFEQIKATPEVRIYRNKKNLGWPSAINQGISLAQAPYLCIVDNDVVFTDNAAEKMLDLCKEENGFVIIGPRLLSVSGDIQKSIMGIENLGNIIFTAFLLNNLFPKCRLFNPHSQNFQNSKYPFNVEALAGACLFFHRRVIDKLQGFDSNFFFHYADLDICWRLNSKGGKVIYCPNISVIHLGSVSTISAGDSILKETECDMMNFYRKRFPRYKRMIVIIFLIISRVNRISILFFLGIVRMNRATIRKSYQLLIKSSIILKNLVEMGI